jgi:putative urate catabolism protein
MNSDYPRDMVGYGRNPPHPQWPNKARLALQFVVNYEEGGEYSVLHGDAHSESIGTEFGTVVPRMGERAMAIESMYEFGSRVGFWRLHRLFIERDIPVTLFGVTTALDRNPEAVAAIKEAGWEVLSHGHRWIDYHGMNPDDERKHIRDSIALQTKIFVERPLGYFLGRRSQNTLDLLAEEGGFLYAQDSYADELPYWVPAAGRKFLLVPYTPDNNDWRFTMAPGFDWGEPFLAYLRDAFDVLYEEGDTRPRLMNVGLHCRIIGRAGRFAALRRFVDYVQSHEHVWFCRGVDVARHWMSRFPSE